MHIVICGNFLLIFFSENIKIVLKIHLAVDHLGSLICTSTVLPSFTQIATKPVAGYHNLMNAWETFTGMTTKVLILGNSIYSTGVLALFSLKKHICTYVINVHII